MFRYDESIRLYMFFLLLQMKSSTVHALYVRALIMHLINDSDHQFENNRNKEILYIPLDLICTSSQKMGSVLYLVLS